MESSNWIETADVHSMNTPARGEYTKAHSHSIVEKQNFPICLHCMSIQNKYGVSQHPARAHAVLCQPCKMACLSTVPPLGLNTIPQRELFCSSM